MISDADLGDIGTYFGNDPRNLVTKHRGHWNDVECSNEKVVMTQSGGLHVDQNFAPDG